MLEACLARRRAEYRQNSIRQGNPLSGTMDFSKILIVVILIVQTTAWLTFIGERAYHRSFSIKTTIEQLNGRSLMEKISSMVDFLDIAVSKFENISSSGSSVELIPIEYNPDDHDWSLGQSMAFVKGPMNELRGDCHRMGGKLIQPSTKSQFDFVKRTLITEGENYLLIDG